MPRDLTSLDFLGVASSLSGRRWVGPNADTERLSDGLAQRGHIPLPVARILTRRGITEPTEIEGFLAPALRDLLPDPRSLHDMEPAAARLSAAVEDKQRIAIFADYDVDGGASAALLIDWLRAEAVR